MTHHNYVVDAEILHDAMKGLGCDDDKLISILGNRSRADLIEIDLAFRAKFGKLLADRLKSETSGHFQKVICNIVHPVSATDAMYLHDSMEGVGTDEEMLNEIMATRDGPEIDAIKQAFVMLYRTGSEKAIKGDTSGKYEHLLLTLHNGPRGKDQTTIDQAQLISDANKLRNDPSEINFTYILGNASHAYNMALVAAYQQTFGRSLRDEIHSHFSGNYRDLLTILVTPRAEYFADKLYHAMKGMGTNDSVLIRVISTRFGCDLPLIKAVFEQKYGKSLYDWVQSETSGHYRKILLALVGR